MPALLISKEKTFLSIENARLNMKFYFYYNLNQY